MKYRIDENIYEVIITKKNNKNTYIKVKDDLKIYVTTNYFVTKNQIIKVLDSNKDFLIKSLQNKKEKVEKKELFYYLGQVYDIIIYENSRVEIYNNCIYVKSKEELNKWYKKQIKKIFLERLDYNYHLFKENIPYPTLKIRTMKTRWGVCNRKTNTVTLNSELIKYSIDKLDYVIIHELSHFIHFNHSNLFWKQVEKYCFNYKQIRKSLKE